MSRDMLGAIIAAFESQKRLTERAIAQVADVDLHRTIDDEANSIAVMMKHMAGNMRSRWTDLLTSDGEKPWRDRDDEFVDDNLSRDASLAVWEEGWSCMLGAFAELTDADLPRTIRIRGREMTVLAAMLRQLSHYGYHVGQIVLTARTLTGDRWQPLSIPRGQSKQYNERAWGKGTGADEQNTIDPTGEAL